MCRCSKLKVTISPALTKIFVLKTKPSDALAIVDINRRADIDIGAHEEQQMVKMMRLITNQALLITNRL